MSGRLFGWLTINQMLFVSHLILVFTIAVGMSYTRYVSEWNLRLEQIASIAQNHFSSKLTWYSTSVAGRNYANLMMPSTRSSVWGVDDLLFMEISGVSDYQNKPVEVRYLVEEKKVWRTDILPDELNDLVSKKLLLEEQKSKLEKDDSVKHKKFDYLINKRAKDLEALRESYTLHNETKLKWSVPEITHNGYVLDESTGSFHIKVSLENVNGGYIWAVFDATEIKSMQTKLLRTLITEASIAMLISILLIYIVTKWIVSPIKELSVSMKQDIEQIDVAALPEIKRRDEIGELARSYSGLVIKIRNQLKVLHKLSDTDPLTGLGSRHKYKRTSIPFVRSALFSDKFVSVLLCDIDNFKAYNDSYGHTDGDNTLCSVADAIENAVGKQGIVYRFGGEEFVVLAHCDGVKKSTAMANRIKSEVENLNIPHKRNTGLSVVTISVGGLVISPDDLDLKSENIRELLSQSVERADQLLYQAKDSGRNLVIVDSFDKA